LKRTQYHEKALFQAVLQQARQRNLLPNEHFTVVGTLLEACGECDELSTQGCKERCLPDGPGNATVDRHGEKRWNETQHRKTDTDAKMARNGKGKEAKRERRPERGAARAKDDRSVAEGSASWSLQGKIGLHVHGCGLQLGPHEEPGESVDVSRDRCVFGGPK
jgi:hypothetical protein